MKELIFLNLFFLFIAMPLFAQVRPVEPIQTNVDIMRQEGQFFTVRISRGTPIKIFVVGREEASFDFSKMKLTVRRLTPGASKDLSITKADGYFSVSEPVEDDAKLEVTTKIKGKKETFHFKMNPAKP